MTKTDKRTYTLPVAQLLTYQTLGPDSPDEWPDYLVLGFTAEHIPDLIRLAIDEDIWEKRMEYPEDAELDEDLPELSAPIHAFRALGQLHAAAAATSLLELYLKYGDDEWVIEELRQVFVMLGAQTLPVLATFLANQANNEWSRSLTASTIAEVGKALPEARGPAIDILSNQLTAFQPEEYELNASLIGSLTRMQAKEAAPLMKRAFEADAVETFFYGDWDDIQEELGLLSPEELEARHLRQEAELKERMALLGGSPFSLSTPTETYKRIKFVRESSKKAKQKKKAAKNARKKNRKR